MKLQVLAGVAGIVLAQAASAAPPINTFIAAGSPSQETGNPSSPASCITTFVHTPTAGRIDYKIRCWNITAVTGAHIHDGTADTASGSILIGLFAGPATGAVDGVLVSGQLLRSQLGDAAFDALLAKMRGDGAYVNVHTSANSGGESRGQIVAVVAPKSIELGF